MRLIVSTPVLLGALGLGVALSSCNFLDEKVKVDDLTELPVYSGTLDYETLNLQVISPYCLGCHSAAGGNQGSLNLETYAALQDNLQGIYTVVFSQKSMPPSGNMPLESYSQLKTWIDAGAPE